MARCRYAIAVERAWREHGDTSGYARTVRLWRRGEPVTEAPVIFEIAADRMGAWSGVDLTADAPRIWFVDRVDFFNTILWLGDETGARQRLDLPTDVWMNAHGDWFAIKLRSAWTVGGKTHAPDTVLGMSLSAFLAGSRDFTVVFEPHPRRSLQGLFWNKGKLVLPVLDELKPHFEICTPSANQWRREKLPGLPATAVIDVWNFDRHESESNGELLANIQDPLTPPSLMLIEGVKSPTLLKQAPKTFTADGLVVTQHEAVSVDGERIPYVQTGPAAETGDAPLYMSAYGGFGLTVKPYYNSALGKLWLERGGTTVQANLRGGGEFGTRWHDAGRYAGKRLAHDDFAAVAADLVRRGVTRPGRIAAEGGSNGGILISNMLTRYPERFGALLCTIPLIDMRRYTKLLAGASWVAEYGDPDKPEEWAWLQTYSAYHAAKPGQNYPPILLATTRRDDRVHPGHARKMAAKLQAMGYDGLVLRAGGGRPRLWQQQPGSRDLRLARPQFPEGQDRLARGVGMKLRPTRSQRGGRAMDLQTERRIVRRAYARQVLAAASVDNPRLADAFAEIPREDFLGPGPWLVWRWTRYVPTPDADPVYLYTNDLVALVAERYLNNGQPSLHAYLMHQAATGRRRACGACRDGCRLLHRHPRASGRAVRPGDRHRIRSGTCRESTGLPRTLPQRHDRRRRRRAGSVRCR